MAIALNPATAPVGAAVVISIMGYETPYACHFNINPSSAQLSNPTSNSNASFITVRSPCEVECIITKTLNGQAVNFREFAVVAPPVVHIPKTMNIRTSGDFRPGGALISSVNPVSVPGESVCYHWHQSIDGGPPIYTLGKTVQPNLSHTTPEGSSFQIFCGVNLVSGAVGESNRGETYSIINNQPPVAPSLITTAGNKAGALARSVCTATADQDGDTVRYVWEQRIDSDLFEQKAVTDLAEASFSIPSTGSTFTRRVKAVDLKGAESSYATELPRAINYNMPPAISGEDVSLGTFDEAAPQWAGSITTDIAGNIEANIVLDGSLIWQIAAPSPIEINLDSLNSIWNKVINGSHEIYINVKDSSAEMAQRALSFTKAEKNLEFYRGQKTTTAALEAQLIVEPEISSWGDGKIEFFVANNGCDAQISWEKIPDDFIGDKVTSAKSYTFVNAEKTNADWCFAVHAIGASGVSGSKVMLSNLTMELKGETIAL